MDAGGRYCPAKLLPAAQNDVPNAPVSEIFFYLVTGMQPEGERPIGFDDVICPEGAAGADAVHVILNNLNFVHPCVLFRCIDLFYLEAARIALKHEHIPHMIKNQTVGCLIQQGYTFISIHGQMNELVFKNSMTEFPFSMIRRALAGGRVNFGCKRIHVRAEPAPSTRGIARRPFNGKLAGQTEPFAAGKGERVDHADTIAVVGGKYFVHSTVCQRTGFLQPGKHIQIDLFGMGAGEHIVEVHKAQILPGLVQIFRSFSVQQSDPFFSFQNSVFCGAVLQSNLHVLSEAAGEFRVQISENGGNILHGAQIVEILGGKREFSPIAIRAGFVQQCAGVFGEAAAGIDFVFCGSCALRPKVSNSQPV